MSALLLLPWLAGCASQVPLQIRAGPADSPAPAVVSERLADYAGLTVRWGGVLIATGNRADATRLTVLALPLTGSGEPAGDDASLGRFIAVVPEFLDPADYSAGRRITVSGTLRAGETGLIGAFPYVYPVVAAQAWYLWPDPVAPYGYPYPWWYDPWYGPWWFGSGYDPWYFPRRHPQSRPPVPPRTPDTVPVMPAPRERPAAPHSDSTAPPGRHIEPAHAEHPELRTPHGRTQTGTRPAARHAAERPGSRPAAADAPAPERGLQRWLRRWRSD